jgi:hypothetical protein
MAEIYSINKKPIINIIADNLVGKLSLSSPLFKYNYIGGLKINVLSSYVHVIERNRNKRVRERDSNDIATYFFSDYTILYDKKDLINHVPSLYLRLIDAQNRVDIDNLRVIEKNYLTTSNIQSIINGTSDFMKIADMRKGHFYPILIILINEIIYNKYKYHFDLLAIRDKYIRFYVYKATYPKHDSFTTTNIGFRNDINYIGNNYKTNINLFLNTEFNINNNNNNNLNIGLISHNHNQKDYDYIIPCSTNFDYYEVYQKKDYTINQKSMGLPIQGFFNTVTFLNYLLYYFLILYIKDHPLYIKKCKNISHLLLKSNFYKIPKNSTMRYFQEMTQFKVKNKLFFENKNRISTIVNSHYFTNLTRAAFDNIPKNLQQSNF